MTTTDHGKKLRTATRAATTIAAGGVLAAAFLTLTGCGSSNQSGTSSTTSAAASSSSTTPAPQGQYDQQALQIFDSIVRGDFNSATVHFDSQMHQKLSPEALASAWSDYQKLLGTYQSHGDPQDVPHGDETVVNIPLQLTIMPGQFRVTFHNNDGTVAGLFFLKAGVPVPST
jgi:hypothetical protein